jgi:hypothetical protein
MSDTEVASFLAEERTVTCATIGPCGWPHLMPLWYVLRDPRGGGAGEPEEPASPRIWAWTYASSQKVRNLERDPRATLQIEAGEQYQELRGVMIESEVVIHRDIDVVRPLGEEILMRYASARGEPPAEGLPAEVAAMVSGQAAKRVGLELIERCRVSWDHRKLGGVY